jgi:hypothetical protein
MTGGLQARLAEKELRVILRGLQYPGR